MRERRVGRCNMELMILFTRDMQNGFGCFLALYSRIFPVLLSTYKFLSTYCVELRVKTWHAFCCVMYVQR